MVSLAIENVLLEKIIDVFPGIYEMAVNLPITRSYFRPENVCFLRLLHIFKCTSC